MKPHFRGSSARGGVPFSSGSRASVGIRIRGSGTIPKAPFVAKGQNIIVPKSFRGKLVEQIDIYILFLFETETFTPLRQRLIQEKLLSEALEDFSKKIGMKAAAIWFINRKGTRPDIERNRYYIDRFDLDTKKAPYIVILRKHPDDWKSGDKFVKFSLNRTPINRVYIILAGVADYVKKGKVPKRRMKLRLIFEACKMWFNDHRKDLKDGSEIAASWLKPN